MIVDCHTHINCAGAGQGGEYEHLAAAEKVDACIVLACPEDSGSKINNSLSEYVGKHKNKLFGFASVDPTKDDISVKALLAVKDKLGLAGAVLYCSSCGFHPAHSRTMQFYESAQELEMPVFFHNIVPLEKTGVLDYAQPYLLDEVARSFPDLKIIIGTMGMPFLAQTIAVIGRHENVYADLTIKPGNLWQVYNIVVSAYECGVMDKLLFGSGYPVSKAGQCIETLLGFNKLLGDTNLPAVPRDKIRGVIERDTLAILGIGKK